ncbi:MAG: hypothetical protein NTZ38_01705, partial [Candidatus Taylorbacteria bacterium]|nr:hypothetical protein [Candidatus Taylorbacteria bacterium]
YEQEFLISLLITLAIEIPVAIVIVRYLYKHKDIKIVAIVFAGLLASGLTLPYLWFILPIYIFNKNTYVILGEVLVMIIEAIIYKQLLKIKWSEAVVTSLLANLSSVTLGRLFQ